MSKTKRILLFTTYVIVLFFLIKINSETIVEWLNKSMFVDYTMDPGQKVKDSFSNGVLLIAVITVFIYSIAGSAIVSILLIDLLMLGLIYANNVKVMERNEFITFSELQTITSPKELLSFVNVSVGSAILVVLGVVLALAGLLFMIRMISRKVNFHINRGVRIVLFLVSLSLLVTVFVKPNYYNEQVLEFEETHVHNWNPLQRARQNGFIPSFMHTVKPTYMDKPADYKKEMMMEISRKYNAISRKINKGRDKSLNDSQTLLYLSESLIDPKKLPNLLLNETPLPFIISVTDNNIGGSMYSQYIGGGTANIEWSVLTSFSLEVFKEPLVVTPYSDFYSDSKNHHTILDFYDNKKVAIHPYTAHLYKRRTIYDAIGFDKFRYLDHGINHTEKLGNHKRVSDEALNKDILEVVNQQNVGLIHILSMQNHSPYNQELPDTGYTPEIHSDFPKKKEKELINYLQGVHASDKAIEELVNKLKNMDKEVNLLFYGDHFPSVFRGTETRYTGDQLHETPWFIYMNKGRSQSGIQLDGLSPAFLVPVLLREGNYYVSPYQGLMDSLLTHGVKRIGKNYVVTEAGKLSDSDLPEDILAMVHDYRMIQYDALFGHDWLPDEFYTQVLE